MPNPTTSAHAVSPGQAFAVWLRVAALSFGGPAGQIAVMHRIVVEEKKWVSESRFLHALNYCMLLPGPEAQQLATYLGWLMNGVAGGLMAGGLFILPGAAAIMALSVVFALWGGGGIVASMFFGMKAAVLAVVVEAMLRVGRRALGSWETRVLAALAFVSIFFFAVPFPIIVVSAGLIGFVGSRVGMSAFGGGAVDKVDDDSGSLLGSTTPEHTKPTMRRALVAGVTWATLWLSPVLAAWLILGPTSVYTVIAVFFAKMAVVTFGGAYAILAYVAQQAVATYHWLTPAEMLNGLGMAETTPGPLIMVLQFVGFMAAFRAPGAWSPVVAGALGGLLATWVTFAPCFLWIFLGGPFIEQLRANKALSGALTAITAAVAGVILNLALWFAIHAMFRRAHHVGVAGLSFDAPEPASLDVWGLALAVGAAVAIFRFKVGTLWTLAGSCAGGAVLFLFGAI